MNLFLWALAAFVIAVVAVVLGSGGVARGTRSTARLLFVALLAVVLSLLLLQLIA